MKDVKRDSYLISKQVQILQLFRIKSEKKKMFGELSAQQLNISNV